MNETHADHIAAIDIGSNAIRLAIARKESQGWTQCLRLREPVRLGADVFRDKLIGPDICKALIAGLKIFHNQMGNFKVRRYRAVATSAMREANNASAICHQIATETGVRVEVISGDEEASLVFAALRAKINIDNGAHLLIDIGGGSVELVAVHNGSILKKESFPLGTVRLLSLQKQKKQPMSQWLPAYLKEATDSFFQNLPPMSTAIGSGGNMDRFSKIMELRKGSPQPVLAAAVLHDLAKDIVQTESEDRIVRFQIRRDRSDVIEPAALITSTLLDRAGASQLHLPQVGLKEGVLGQLQKLA